MARNGPIRFLRMVALTAALTAVLFFAIGGSIWHQDAPGADAGCALCHVAHLVPLVGVSVGMLTGPMATAWIPPAQPRIFQASAVALEASPRAPPLQ